VLRNFLVGCLLSMFAAQSSAQVVIQDSAGHRLNTWSARANNGHAFFGTWTGVADTISGKVRGGWTLIDKQGRTLAAGTWEAEKSVNGWTGSWRARVEQRAGDYGGTWSAKTTLSSDAKLPALFEKALISIAGGNWWFGNHSGSWSIRAYK